MRFIKKLTEELESRDYKLAYLTKTGNLQSSLGYFNVPSFVLFLIAIGIVSICLLIIPGNYILLLLFCSILIAILLCFNQVIFVQKFISFLGTLFLPVISVSFICSGYETKSLHLYKNQLSDYLWLIYDAFIHFIKITFITFVGSILISSLLSTEIFIKAVASFSGVKLANLLPLIFIGYYFYLKDRKNIDVFLDRNLKVKHLVSISILAVLLSIFLIFFISRTDNYGIPFINKTVLVEDKLRMFLENIFISRPRLKEFLIGHPLLLLGIAMYYHSKDEKLKLISLFFITIGTIGQISIVNTFCHIHTPFIFSVHRTLYGILIGSILGSILIITWKFICSRSNKKIASR